MGSQLPLVLKSIHKIPILGAAGRFLSNLICSFGHPFYCEYFNPHFHCRLQSLRGRTPEASQTGTDVAATKTSARISQEYLLVAEDDMQCFTQLLAVIVSE